MLRQIYTLVAASTTSLIILIHSGLLPCHFATSHPFHHFFVAFAHSQTIVNKMADMDKKQDPISESVEPAIESSIEKGDVSSDLDLLGKLSSQDSSVSSVHGLIHHYSPIGLQAGIEASLFNDSGFCYRFQYYGSPTIDCLDSVVFYASWACWDGLGKYLHLWGQYSF